MDLIINALIFIVTVVLTVQFFCQDGEWHFRNGVPAFRYFTVLSNDFCAVAALLLCFAPGRTWAWTLKYIGTAAVTVTMLTVLFFLGPNMGYKKLLSGVDLFMHLLTPLCAIVSFCFFEKWGMTFCISLLGMLPVLLYAILYLYKVILAPESRRWEDFYGFNKNGKWPISLAAMLIGSFAVSMLFLFLQNGI